jgi:molybdenum cofactor synthesis domain-containing protein
MTGGADQPDPALATAAIVVIGNEVLSAKVTDLNGPWLSQELRALGVELRRIETVPDEIPLIVDAVKRAQEHGHWVFTSGGIGPTHDDVTIAALAQAFDRKVVIDPKSLELLERKFGARMNPALRRLAEIPEGSQLIWDEVSLFPVITLERVVILPGVPMLFREGFARLRERFRAAPIFSRAVYLALGESRLAEHLDATVAAFPSIAIGSYPRFDEADHRVKVTFDGRSLDEVARALLFFVTRLPSGAVVREE